MSFGIDVNILLYASDSASAPHAKAHEFLRGCDRWRGVLPGLGHADELPAIGDSNVDLR